jgi:hypothetical protein
MMFGMLMMLLVIVLPILLIVLLLGGAALFSQNWAHNTSPNPIQAQIYQPGVNTSLSTTHYCSHCGEGLQASWTHCPQCGAPIQ